VRGPVLVCAATARELEACGEAGPGRIHAVTGAGIPMTLVRLLPLLREHAPSMILNVGIAGAYPGSGLAIGDLAGGESEVFGDLGLELPGPEAFRPLGETPWADPEYRRPIPLATAVFAAAGPGAGSIRIAKGCTVNACAGTPSTGALRRRVHGADFESMEGAAVALAGMLAGIPVAEIRAISNFAAGRDMRPENIELALGNLGVYMRGFLAAIPAAVP
jgi:futalosine hydrolase